MKIRSFLSFAAAVLLGSAISALAEDPVVSNLTTYQRPGPKLEVITCDMAAVTPTTACRGRFP
jgi:hypothetical protein